MLPFGLYSTLCGPQAHIQAKHIHAFKFKKKSLKLNKQVKIKTELSNRTSFSNEVIQISAIRTSVDVAEKLTLQAWPDGIPW